VQPFRSQNMGFDQRMQRVQDGGADGDPRKSA